MIEYKKTKADRYFLLDFYIGDLILCAFKINTGKGKGVNFEAADPLPQIGGVTRTFNKVLYLRKKLGIND